MLSLYVFSKYSAQCETPFPLALLIFPLLHHPRDATHLTRNLEYLQGCPSEKQNLLSSKPHLMKALKTTHSQYKMYFQYNFRLLLPKCVECLLICFILIIMQI